MSKMANSPSIGSIYMTHIGTIKLESEKVILRRFEADDATAMNRNLYSDLEAMRFLPWGVHTNIAQTQKHLAGYAIRGRVAPSTLP